MPSEDNRRVAVLAAAMLVAIMPPTLVVPVLKPLVQDRFAAGDLETSLFMSVNMIAAFVTAPVAGFLSDRLGRRKSIVVGALVVDALLLASLNRAPSYGVLMALRACEGAAHITAMALLLAMAGDLAHRASSGKVMGAMGAAMMFGVALGAPIGGQLGKVALHLPLDASAGLAVLGALLVLAALRDEPPANLPESPARGLRLVLEHRQLAVPYTFAFVDRFTVGFFVSSFPLYLGNVLGAGPERVGLLLGAFLIPFAALCYPMGRLSERISLAVLVGGGSLAYGLAVCFVGLVPEGALFGLMLLLGVLSSVMFVPTLVLTGELSGPHLKATAMGGYHAAGSLGFLTGPIVAGSVSELVGASFGAATGYASSFVVAGASEIVCVLVALPALARLRKPTG